MTPKVTVATAGESVVATYPDAAPVKRPAGLVCVNPPSLPAVAKYSIDGGVIKVPWATVNPDRGIYDWSAVDSVLSAYPNVKFPLRIQHGNGAPDYVKALTGTVLCTNSSRGLSVNAAKWWRPEARDAWAAMIQAAGAKYGNHPRIVMVTAALPTTVFSEPYMAPGGDAATGMRLWAEGLTRDLHAETIEWCVDTIVAAFPRTVAEVPLHGDFQYPTQTGVARSVPFGLDLANRIAAKHGQHVAFTDYGFGTTDTYALHAPAPGETMQNTTDIYTWLCLRGRATGPEGGPVGVQLTMNGKTDAASHVAVAEQIARLGYGWAETYTWLPAGTECPRLDAALKANQTR